MTFRKVLITAAVILFAFGLLFFSKETSAAAVSGLSLCVKALIPSLFPFFTVTAFATEANLISGRLFSRPMRVLFNLPGECATAFLLGLCGGYPVGAAAATGLYSSGVLSKSQTERLLSFCNNCGPAFILGVCGTALFGGSYAGVLLYGSHILASLTVGILFRGKPQCTAVSVSKKAPEAAVSYRKIFISSVRSALSGTLNICAYVVFFSVAVRLLYLFGIIPFTAKILALLLKPFGVSALYAEKLIGGFFEVTTGVYGIVSSGAKLSSQLTGAAFMLGWAGLSVHFQVLDFISKSGLSPKPYIRGKLLHGVFSAVYAYIGTRLLPFDTGVSKMVSNRFSALLSLSPAMIFAVCAAFCILFLIIALLLSKKCRTIKTR